jgi:transcriptional regulator GlxA family with amidase domain
MPKRIEILAFADCQLLDVAGPLQVFASANDLARAAGAALPYELLVVSRDSMTMTSAGLGLASSALPESEPGPDTLIAVGGWGVYAACLDANLIDWIIRRATISRRVASVCSGAFLLGTAGLLDGRRAVTHWQRCDEFARHFPKVRLEPDPIFIRDGDVWTSAGVTAGIDLALALVEDDLGREVALAVSRQLVVFLKRPGGQSQFSAALTLQDNGGRFDGLHSWLLQNLHRPLGLGDMADHVGMSARNLSRRYREQTGRTPARAVEDLRLETARRLLEQGLSVGRVVTRCGFGTEETMRRAFVRRIGVSPQAYRDRFAG